MKKVFALYNSKGGVGKTSSCLNLAWTAAFSGRRVLLWDLDPQGAASFYLKRDEGLGNKARKFLSGKAEWKQEVRATAFDNLWLIPADHSLRDFEIIADAEKKSRRVLNEWIKDLIEDFDVIFLDCPPGLTLVSENIFKAADWILVPVEPSPLSLRTLNQMTDFFEDGKKDLKKIHPFASMCDLRKRVHQEAVRQLQANPATLTTTIPLLSEIEKMGITLLPSAFKAGSRSRDIYSRLWLEVDALK